MDRALDAVFASPRDHAPSGSAVLDAAQPHFAEKLDSRLREFPEVVFHHALFEHRRSRVDLHSARPKRLKGTLREDRHRFQADNVLRPSRRMNFPGRYHRRHAAMQAALNPA